MTARLIHQRLTDAAATCRDHDAVLDRRRACSYGDLEEQANRIGNTLVGLGVSPGDRVGVYMTKSIEAVAAVYGILKSGAAYVPLDPSAPSARLGYIVRDCGLRGLVVGGRKANAWPEFAGDSALEHVVVLDGASDQHVDTGTSVHVVGASDVAAAPSTPPTLRSEPELAYILYTSGSTGVPKGVMLTHGNALAFVDWAIAAVGVTADDRLSSHAPLHFDLSVFDLFAASTAGATTVLVPQQASVLPVELRRFIATAEISVWYSVPTVLSMLADRGGLAPGDLPSLRTVIFAGEVFPTVQLARLMELLQGVEFWNFYGPTETNVCTAYRVPAPPDPKLGDIPIGTPITGVTAYVVREDGREVAPQEAGELLVGGPTVMQGYWADDEKTTRQLVPDPRVGDRLVYRTGDLVAEHEDGNFRFLGRRDHQIKTRGYRVELGEIERVLQGHGAIVECVAVAVPDDVITNRICAHVVTRQDISASDLATFCREHLPPYMIPEHFQVWDALPRTSTGKVDRQLLGSGREPSS